MLERIELLEQKLLIGTTLKMSFVNDRTYELWKRFMTVRKHIKNTIGNDLYSIQVYDTLPNFNNIDPEMEFTKWAAIETERFEDIPANLECFILKSGLYAVFIHKGSSRDLSTFNYIFTVWLPSSDYLLDDRPHFEVLGEKYKNNDPNSEEEIWIPIRHK